MPPRPEKEYSHPTFYACYLLRTVKPGLRTYVGSTPNPPRRLRQHNGEVKGGAVYTRRWKPWHMEMIVYGFPSKLSALQFEWAWIHPNKSRHLRHPPGTIATSRTQCKGKQRAAPSPSLDLHQPPSSKATLPPPLFPRNRASNQPLSKATVARALLAVPPFKRLPLRVRLFSASAARDWEEAAVRVEKLGLGELDVRRVRVVRDYGGVDGKRERREEGEEELEGIEKGGIKLEVDDYAFASNHHIKHLALLSSLRTSPPSRPTAGCTLCPHPIDLTSHLIYSLCPSTNTLPPCLATAHLTCLAAHFLRAEAASSTDKEDEGAGSFLLPMWGPCPERGCAWEGSWGEVVRGCWAGKKGAMGVYDPKVRRGRRGKAAEEAVTTEEGEDDEDDDEEEEDEGEEDERPRRESDDDDEEEEDEDEDGGGQDTSGGSLSTLLASATLRTPTRVNSPVNPLPKPPSQRRPHSSKMAISRTMASQGKKKKKASTLVSEEIEDERVDEEEDEGVVFERLLGLRR